jgi:signal transduction histidine kinase/CheY-like chemotaxis protein
MLIGHYEIPLVLISVLVAIFASYTALSLAGRVTGTHGSASRRWIAGGAIAMGTGIWSMHFIGMLAFRLPIPMGFDLGITLLSLLLPIVVSGLALWHVSQPQMPPKRLLSGALLMGLGINTMHYTGMAAMRMEPDIQYDPWLFAASVAIAIAASGGALWMAYRLRRNVPHVLPARIGSAIVMGIAIAGMHYTGMAAANFPLGSVCRAASDGFSHDGLAIMVIIATMAVLIIALLTSAFDARLAARSQILALSQASAEERQLLLMREREARKQVERMSEMKDEFLATLSHELRTPLNAILGWAQLLRIKAHDEATFQKGLETIERNANVQARLIEDLLDMSRIISGKVRLDMTAVDPAAFIGAAIETIRPAALAKNIELETELAPDLPHIFGDAGRLQQIIWNLLSNAVKFTPGGGKVSVALEKRSEEIVIRVRDTGIGIEADFLPYIFDRFSQADATTTRRYGGLGIGLAIVKNLVELHGGAVQVSSAGEGQGTTFAVHLPVRRAQADPAGYASPAVAPAAHAVTRFAPADLAGIKVVVIDDEADAVELVRQILLECGAEVFAASNAGQGLSLVRAERPDAVISDIGMSDEDGYRLIRRIRALEASEGGRTPAIALTAFARKEDQRRTLEAGFDRYLSKPVDASELISILAALVGQRAAMQR